VLGSGGSHISPQWPGSVHVVFVVYKVAPGQVLFSTSSLVFPCHYHSTVALYVHIMLNSRSVAGSRSETSSHSMDMNNLVSSGALIIVF
jgi:hypothetical protein